MNSKIFEEKFVLLVSKLVKERWEHLNVKQNLQTSHKDWWWQELWGWWWLWWWWCRWWWQWWWWSWWRLKMSNMAMMMTNKAIMMICMIMLMIRTSSTWSLSSRLGDGGTRLDWWSGICWSTRGWSRWEKVATNSELCFDIYIRCIVDTKEFSRWNRFEVILKVNLRNFVRSQIEAEIFPLVQEPKVIIVLFISLL